MIEQSRDEVIDAIILRVINQHEVVHDSHDVVQSDRSILAMEVMRLREMLVLSEAV